MKQSVEVNVYIAQFPKNIQILLNQLRSAIIEAAPDAEEYISYRMPAYKQNGPVVYFAAYKNHIGFYPTGTGIAAFKDALKEFKSSKGAIQFQLDKPLPLKLIMQIVKFKIKENLKV